MPRHEKATRGTGPSTDPATTPTTIHPPEEWWQKALFIASLIAVVGLLAGFEYQAGVHGGFGAWVSAGVPLAFDAYALWTWLDPNKSVWDELAAVAILAASVGLSIAQPPQKWQAFGIGMIAIVVEWRIVARRRAAATIRHSLAAALANIERLQREVGREMAAGGAWKARAEEAARQVDDVRRRLAAAERAAAAATAGGASGGRSGGSATEKPAAWGTTKETQIEWLRDELAEGRRYTGEQVQELMGLGSAKAGRDRLAEARRPRLVAKEA
jgi:hypothetical protein